VNTSRDAEAARCRRAGRLKADPSGPSGAAVRERLLDATAELVGQGAYATTTVSQISKHAAVSTATFYTMFGDKEECFLAAHRRAASGLVRELERRAKATEASMVWRATLEAIFELAAERPATLLLLTGEAKLTTRHALEARDRLMADIESIIERPRQAAHGGELPDIPAKALLGASFRLLVRRPHDGGRTLDELRDGLVGWAATYQTAAGRGWNELTPTAGLHAGPPNYGAGLAPPPRPSRGRTRLSAEQVAENQRQRILHAIAEVTAEKGYIQTTVANVVAQAGLAREVFYRHFRDKQDAFTAAYETGFQTLMALSVGAFYTSSDWPERIWAASRAYTDFMANFPSFAHLGMVESHTVSPELVARVDERVMAFTFFLQEGNAYLQAQADTAHSVTAEAIAMAMYELVSHMIRHGRNDELPGLLPLMTYIVLTPYTGAEVACEFVARKVRETVDSSPT
jgi:AcrR family transcriptional regulator